MKVQDTKGYPTLTLSSSKLDSRGDPMNLHRGYTKPLIDLFTRFTTPM